LRRSRIFAAALALLAGAIFVGIRAAQPAPDARKAFADATRTRTVLNIDEYIANVVYVSGKWTGIATASSRKKKRGRFAEFRPEFFKAADRNGDGKLSVGEAVAAKVIDFFEIDTNHDGVISIEEVLVYERALPTAAPRK
jgi:hypothetical protein